MSPAVSPAVPTPPPAPLPTLPRTFRPRRGRIAILVAAVALTVSLAVVAVILPSPGRTADGFTTTDRLGFVAVGLVLVGGLVLLARPHVVADADGLRVVNVGRSHTLAWSQVVGVRLAPGDAWLVLDLDDGSTLAAMGVQSADGDRGRRDAETIGRLAETLGAPPAGAGPTRP